MGAQYSKANTMTFVPDGDAVPGANVVLTAAANHHAWQIPLGNGPYIHMASGLCLTATATADALTLEACNGTADQWWIRVGNTPWQAGIQHRASGLCLSSEILLRGGRSSQRQQSIFTLLPATSVSQGAQVLTQGGVQASVVSAFDPGGWNLPVLPVPSLHLAECASDRTDQLWTTTDPTTPGPIIR
jgi:hypothetical protein